MADTATRMVEFPAVGTAEKRRKKVDMADMADTADMADMEMNMGIRMVEYPVAGMAVLASTTPVRMRKMGTMSLRRNQRRRGRRKRKGPKKNEISMCKCLL